MVLRVEIITSGVTQRSLLGALLFILYASEMLKLVENRRFACADDATLLAVASKPAATSCFRMLTKQRLVDPGL